MMQKNSVTTRIESLRRHRITDSAPPAAGASMRQLSKTLRRSAEALGDVGAIWEAHCPPTLLDRCRIDMQRRTLRVHADDAATRYALDRWLRAGGQRAIIESARIPISAVRVMKFERS